MKRNAKSRTHGQRGLMTTRSGRNVLEAENVRQLSVSRKPSGIEQLLLLLFFNTPKQLSTSKHTRYTHICSHTLIIRKYETTGTLRKYTQTD